MLDVSLDGVPSFPVADALAARGVPFVFATGHGEAGLREDLRGRPALQKPFRLRQLALALAGAGVPQIDPVLLQLSQKQRREREARWEQGGGVHMLALAATRRRAGNLNGVW